MCCQTTPTVVEEINFISYQLNVHLSWVSLFREVLSHIIEICTHLKLFRWCDPHNQMDKNYSDLSKWEAIICKSWLLKTPLYPLSFSIQMFIYLKLCPATATHNFK